MSIHHVENIWKGKASTMLYSGGFQDFPLQPFQFIIWMGMDLSDLVFNSVFFFRILIHGYKNFIPVTNHKVVGKENVSSTLFFKPDRYSSFPSVMRLLSHAI